MVVSPSQRLNIMAQLRNMQEKGHNTRKRKELARLFPSSDKELAEIAAEYRKKREGANNL